jgi:hypothetical protein
VIWPVGEEPPARVAVTWTDPPRTTSADAAVEMVGEALATATDSLAPLQALETGSLSVSPE